MILIGNYTCSRSINEKSHLCLAKNLTCVCFSLVFAKHACDFSLILLEPCNFLYKHLKNTVEYPYTLVCSRHFSLFLIGACGSRGMSREIIQKSNLPGDSAKFPGRFGRIPCLGEKT